jgi:hypothetical protein
MARRPTKPKLTSPNPALDRLIWQTKPGQAHWAGTGPEDKRCRECRYFDHRERRYTDGTLMPAPCAMYRRLTNGTQGNSIPHDAYSCKYFEAAEVVPRISA